MFELNLVWQNLQIIIQKYGTLGAFLASLSEEIISLIPSALVLFFLGSIYFFQKTISFWLILKLIFFVSLAASIGSTLGAALLYFLSYLLGKPFIERFSKFFALNWRRLQKIEKFLHKKKREAMILLFLRTIPIVPSTAINVFFGLLRFHWLKFFLISFFGNWLRAIMLVFLGWQLSFYFDEAVIFFQKLETFGWLTVVVILIVIFYSLKKK